MQNFHVAYSTLYYLSTYSVKTERTKQHQKLLYKDRIICFIACKNSQLFAPLTPKIIIDIYRNTGSAAFITLGLLPDPKQ